MEITFAINVDGLIPEELTSNISYLGSRAGVVSVTEIVQDTTKLD